MKDIETTASGVRFRVAAGDLFIYVPGALGVALVAPQSSEGSAIELELRVHWGNLIARASYRDLVALAVDMTDVYPAVHWARTGSAPAYHTPDEDVYIPGRNIVLLGKAGVFCGAAGLDRLVIGTLDHNPFPDATPSFRHAMASALSLGMAHPLVIDAPYARVGKAEVIQRDELLALGSWHAAKEAGKMRVEGKDYIAQDGDVMEFRFNV